MRNRAVMPSLVLATLLGVDSGALAQAAPPASPEVSSAEQALVAVGVARVADIAVQGSTVFSEAELDAFTAPYERDLISFERLQELRHELSRRYVERGYVTSGVVIPEQRVANGVIVLSAIEGELTGIEVSGNRRLRSGPIERRVQHYLESPLNIADMQAGLNVLQKDPLVERVNAELVPGTALGESLLKVDVTERAPFELGVYAANDRSPSIGEDRASLALAYRGLVGNGDALTGRFGVSDGADDNALYYEVPLTPGGTRLDVALSEQDADIVEEPFSVIDISSHIETWNVTARRPFRDGGARTMEGFVGFEHRRSQSTLLDTPFSFSPGDVDGEAIGSSLLLGAEWSRTAGARTLALRGTFQVGVDALDATQNVVGPDGDFTLFAGQLQLAQSLRWRDSRVLVRGLVQIADDALLAMYKLPIGGRYSVRGYRESQLVRDHGFAASAELQFPAFVDETGQRRGRLDLAVFGDYGLSIDADESPFTEKRAHLSSVGFGLLWRPFPGLNFEIYRGVALTDVDNPDESLQDDGIHYALAFHRGFRR